MNRRKTITLACLAPEGRAGKNAEVDFAHANGRYLAERGASLLGDGALGEVAEAFATGAFHGGGRFRVAVAYGTPAPKYPAPVELIALHEGQSPAAWIGLEADGIWALPPRVADLDRYFETWLGAEGKPVVCMAPGEEFRLLKGIIDEVVRARREAAVQRLIFASSPEAGWELLDDLIRNPMDRGPMASA